MKEWSVENESSFAKINMMVVEDFLLWGEDTSNEYSRVSNWGEDKDMSSWNSKKGMDKVSVGHTKERESVVGQGLIAARGWRT